MTARGSSPPGALPPGARIIRAIAWLVPSSRQEAWIAEWCAELTAASDRGASAARLRRHAMGALPDAMYLHRRHGADQMIVHDLRFAFRSIVHRPALSAVVIATLALGIGASAAIFSVVSAVLLRPLPFDRPDALVFLVGAPTDGDSAKVGRSSSYPDYIDIRDRATSFEHLAATASRANLALQPPGAEPTLVTGAWATANLFATLGVTPALGRSFTADEDRSGGAPTVVLSHPVWQTWYHGDPAILGRGIMLDGRLHTVVGVMPPGFAHPRNAELWTPAAQHPQAGVRGVHAFSIVGRLSPGATLARATADVRTIARQLETAYPDDNARRTASLEPMHATLVRNVRPMLVLLAAGVALVLVLVCTNVASLVLARAAAREREAAVRAALGAARGQLVRQLMTESVVVALVGGIAGIGVAYAGVTGLVASGMVPAANLDAVRVDGPVLGFIAAVSVLAGVGIGLLPALRFASGGAARSLRAVGRGVTGDRSSLRVRQLLVAAEISLALVLVLASGLLVKSFWRLQQVDPGFQPEGLVALEIALPQTRYPTNAQVRSYFERARAEVAGLPGVESAAIALAHPMDEGFTSSFSIAGRAAIPDGERPEARVRPVSPGYFSTVGMRLLAGRDVATTDGVGMPGVVVINQAFAARHFPGEDPLGRVIVRGPGWWAEMPSEFRIVGVVSDERYLGLARDGDPATYFSFPQFAFSTNGLVIRTSGDAAAMLPAIRATLAPLDPALPLTRSTLLADAVDAELAPARFNMQLIGAFGLVALLLAAIGVYGVLTQLVSQRTPEIGIRMALGASPGRLVTEVVRQGMLLAAAGIVAGTALAFAGTPVVERLLHEVEPTDPAVFVVVVLTLALVAAVSAYLPARRATTVAPATALRAQ